MTWWGVAVHISTLVWTVMFVVGFLAFDADLIGLEPLIQLPAHVEPVWDVVNWIVWGVFVVDVYIKYRRSDSFRVFVKKNWLDLLLLVPFFRVLLLFRVVRLLRLVRLFRTVGFTIEAVEVYFFVIRRMLKSMAVFLGARRTGRHDGQDT